MPSHHEQSVELTSSEVSLDLGRIAAEKMMDSGPAGYVREEAVRVARCDVDIPLKYSTKPGPGLLDRCCSAWTRSLTPSRF